MEEWGGLVWICLDPEAEPLLSYLAPLPEHLACYHLDTFAIVADQSVAWDCNWKVAVDAFHETYHNLATHPQLMPVAGDVNVQIDCYDRHSRFLLPSGVPAPAYRQRDRPTAAQIAAFARYDFDATGFEGTADEVLAPFQRHKLAWLRDRGYPVEDLDLGTGHRELPLHGVPQHPDLVLPGADADHPQPAAPVRRPGSDDLRPAVLRTGPGRWGRPGPAAHRPRCRSRT